MDQTIEAIGDGEYLLKVSGKIFSKQSILNSIYRFSNAASIQLGAETSSCTEIHFMFNGMREDEARNKINNFYNDLVDSEVRQNIELEFGKMSQSFF